MSSKRIKPITHRVTSEGVFFENRMGITNIEKPLHQEFCYYDNRNMTDELQDRGWMINHQKVYRLMKEPKLLSGGNIRAEPLKRDFMRFRTPEADSPLQ